MIALAKQDFAVKVDNKIHYGEVTTDYWLIEKTLDLLPVELFRNPQLKWLDPCCGKGYFLMVLYQRLFQSLQYCYPNPELRHQHIVSHMLWMVEVNGEHYASLCTTFGENANIALHNFLYMENMDFDIIIGNPPFVTGGGIKVPTNRHRSKKCDGRTSWPRFVTTTLSNLRTGGYLAMILPSIWMKSDHSLHQYICKWRIERLHSFSSTESNKYFHGRAQTPISLLCLQKVTPPTPHVITLWDTATQQYLPYTIGPLAQESLPLWAPSIIDKLRPYIEKYTSIAIIKTSMRPGYRNLDLSVNQDTEHPYPNISTCLLVGNLPVLKVNYSNRPCSYAGIPKLILAHKMYGFPYLDEKGIYGISNRDNYVIVGKSKEAMRQLQHFLSTRLALTVFKATRYRMQYLERYAFGFLPDITLIPDFPTVINDESIANYFALTSEERALIQRTVKKQYGIFQKIEVENGMEGIGKY